MTWTRAAALIDEALRKPPILAALQGFATRDSATRRSRLRDVAAGSTTSIPALQADRKGLVGARGPAPSRSRNRAERGDCLDLDRDPRRVRPASPTQGLTRRWIRRRIESSGGAKPMVRRSSASHGTDRRRGLGGPYRRRSRDWRRDRRPLAMRPGYAVTGNR